MLFESGEAVPLLSFPTSTFLLKISKLVRTNGGSYFFSCISPGKKLLKPFTPPTNICPDFDFHEAFLNSKPCRPSLIPKFLNFAVEGVKRERPLKVLSQRSPLLSSRIETTVLFGSPSLV